MNSGSSAGRPRTLLVVTYHFPPSAASGTHRILGFARHLPANGWKVAVVAPPTLPWEPVDNALLTQVPDSTRVFNVNFPYGVANWPLRRLFPWSGWLIRAWPTLPRAVKACRPDAVLTSGPPHCVHMAGAYLKRRFGIPWVADFRDPWVTGQFLNGRWGRASRLDRIRESLVFRSADAVVVNAPNVLAELVDARPPLKHKIHSVTNGFDPALFAGITRAPHSRCVIAHPGSLYAGRDPRPFLDAVAALVARDPALRERLCIDFIGSPEYAGSALEGEIARRGLTGVAQVTGSVPYRESLQRMADADVLLLLDSPDRRIGVPAKLYEYLGAKRPVLALALADSDTHWVLRESGVPFRLAGIDDVAGIASGLEDLIRLSAEPVPDPQASRFSRAAITAELAGILNELPLAAPRAG